MGHKIVTILVQAITTDGKIARNECQFPDWTGKEDKKIFQKITMNAGVMIMGAKTFAIMPAPLPNRKHIVMTRTPKTSDHPDVVFTDASPKEILHQLEEDGFTEVVIAGGAQVNTLFAREGLIDKIELTVCPLIFGEGISLFTEPLEMSLFLQETRLLGDSLGDGRILCNYDVIYSARLNDPTMTCDVE